MTDGTYVITVRDVAGPGQAALHGLLRRIHDLGPDVPGVHPEPPDTGVRHQVPVRCRTGHRSTARTIHPGKRGDMTASVEVARQAEAPGAVLSRDVFLSPAAPGISGFFTSR